jgi:hypothetical protein
MQSSDQKAKALVVSEWGVALLLMFLDGAPWWDLHVRLTIGGFVLEAVGVTLLGRPVLRTHPEGA